MNFSVANENTAIVDTSFYTPAKKPLRAPLGGDVFFSARRAQPEAAQIAKAFNANRIEWVYSTDFGYVDSLKLKGFITGLTLNANPKMEGYGYALNFDNLEIIAPWMKTWGAKWATTASPVASSTILGQARRLVASGADAIQFDDPELQYSITKWGDSDFSSASLVGFQTYINRPEVSQHAIRAGLIPSSTENYKSFLIRTHGVKSAADYILRKKSFPSTVVWEKYLMTSVRDFHVSLKKLLATEKGKYTPLSFNLDLHPQEKSLFLADLADYVMAESSDYSVVDIALRTATARAVPTGYVASILPRDIQSTRHAIALHYAMGATVVAPWDTYMPDIKGVPQPRFFGRSEDFSDMFKFIRRNRSLFDHSEAPAVAVIVIPIEATDLSDLRRVVGLLSKSAIPFAFEYSGGRFKNYSIDEANLKNIETIIRIGNASDFDVKEWKKLESLHTKVRSSKDIDSSWADERVPLTIRNGRDVSAHLRVSNKMTGAIALHLVSAPMQEAVSAVQPMEVTIKRDFLPSNLRDATIHSVDSEPIPVPLNITKDSVSFVIQRPQLWSVVSFNVESK
ncbi:MAG: hypothetical protein H7252_05905 [Cytophaga sp.]|nr:hypothetical protein [Undibacterium sp.]